MFTVRFGRVVASIGCAALCGTALAQPEPVAFVTVQTGGGARRADSGDAFKVAAGTVYENGLAPGEGVATAPDGSAVLLLQEYDVVIRLDSATEFTVIEVAALGEQIAVAPVLRRGSALVVQRSGDDRWMLVAGESGAGSAYALARGASVSLSVIDGGVSFSSGGGEVYCYQGPIPAGDLLTGAGQPADQTGVALSPGQSVASANLRQPRTDDTVAIQASALGQSLYEFGLSSGTFWIQKAERGDFTPVRASERGTFEVVRGEIGAGTAFDSPSTVLVTPSAVTLSQPIRTAPLANPAQQLIASGIPSSVVVGQRLRRTRIIGSSGTTNGQIRFNPNAEQLIRLPGR